MPVGRSLQAMRCSTSVIALARNANVTAICVAMSNAPNLLRRMAESMGRTSIDDLPLLSFELPRGLHMCGPPCRIQSRHDRCAHCKQYGNGCIGQVQVSQRDKI